MSIRIQCPSCGKELKTADAKRGRKMRCPRCQDTFTVPVDAPDGGPIDVDDEPLDVLDSADDGAPGDVGDRKAVRLRRRRRAAEAEDYEDDDDEDEDYDAGPERFWFHSAWLTMFVGIGIIVGSSLILAFLAILFTGIVTSGRRPPF